MKQAAKIFIIIGMIVGFWTILPLIFGILTLKKMNNNEPLTTVDKILVLLFVSMIGGILLLCDKDEEAA